MPARLRKGAVVLVGSLLAVTTTAQTGLAGSTAKGGDRPSSTTIAKTFHSNAAGGTTATISTHGNVVDYLSPDSASAGRYEHIGVGAIGEGYVLCYTGPSGTVNAYDTGAAETGFGPSTTVSQNATSITVRRNTSDNRLQLTNQITFLGEERAVRIKMTVKNITGSPVPNVVLRRQVDFDVDTGGPDGWAGFAGYHATTSSTSAFAWTNPDDRPADKESHAMQMRSVASTSGFTRFAYVTSQILDNSCDASSKLPGGPQFGDFGETIRAQIGLIPTGASRFITIEYLRF